MAGKGSDLGTSARPEAVGVVVCVVGAMRILDMAPVAMIGWSLIGATLLTTAITAMWPPPAPDARY